MDAIIETPAGSRFKYKWDDKRKMFVVSKLLPAAMAFPFDFGFFPGTKADDGDPLDVMVLSEQPLAQGAVVPCKVFGGLRVRQSDRPGGKLVDNDRMLAVPECSPHAFEWTSIAALDRATLGTIESFLRTYVELQGRSFQLLGAIERHDAIHSIEAAA